MILTVDYDKNGNNVYICTDGATGCIYDVKPNTVAEDIGYAVECYMQDYVEAGEVW